MTDAIIEAFPRETIETFLGREKSAVTTSAIATRFGWDRREADRQLRRLERAGSISSRVEVITWEGGGGRSKVWFLAETAG